MKISVVILNWNRPQDTIAAVESTLRQGYNAFDVLVWDNASSDASKEILVARFGADPRVRLAFGDANYGVAGGRNRAFPMTDGDVLLSLDSDAVFESEDALSRVANCLGDQPDIGAVSFEVQRPDGHLMWPFSRPSATWRARAFDTMRVDGCAFAVRRSLYDRIGGFPEHFSPYGAEDQHFALRVLGQGQRVHYLPGVRVIHAFTPRGRTALQFRMHVRNSLWIPLELFPFPFSLLSFGKLACSLLRDGLEQKQVPDFFAGACQAVFGFTWARRHSIGYEAWRSFRRLVAEDKREAAAGTA
jgi:GT2 family glycosyltransferase